MRALPPQPFAIESELPPDELARRLAALVEPPRRFRWPWERNPRPLEGRIEQAHFGVRPLTRGQRNGFRLWVIGDVEARGQGSALRGVIRFSRPGLLLFTLLLGVSLIAGIVNGVHLLRERGMDWRIAIAIALPLAWYAMPMAAYWIGANRARRALLAAAG